MLCRYRHNIQLIIAAVMQPPPPAPEPGGPAAHLGNVPYDTAEAAAARPVFGFAHDLRPRNVAAVAVAPPSGRHRDTGVPGPGGRRARGRSPRDEAIGASADRRRACPRL